MVFLWFSYGFLRPMSLAPTSSTQAGIDEQVLYADAQAVTVVQSRVEEVEPLLWAAEDLEMDGIFNGIPSGKLT